jgi:peroxiredoxin
VKLSRSCCARTGLAAAFVVLAASVSALLLVPRYSRPVATADVGTVAPSFELAGNNGEKFSLADSRGQVVVLFFSALGDPLITRHYERVDRLAREYADDGRVKILGINIAYTDNLDPAKALTDGPLASHAFPTLLDERASVASRYAATDTPLMVIIDSHGVVRYRGPMDQPSSDLTGRSNSFVEEAIRNLAENATLASAK